MSPGEGLLGEFLRHLALERGLAPNTSLAYAGDLRDYVAWLKGRDALTVGAGTLSDYLWHLTDARGLKPASVSRHMESLRAFYRFLAAEERIPEDPSRNLRSPRLPQRLPRYLTVGEMERLLRAPDRGDFAALRTKTVVELLYATGMRASELLGLRPEYVNLREGWVRVFGKRSKERMVPLHERARAAVERYLRRRERLLAGKGADPEVFVSRGGKALSRVSLWRDLRALGRRAGLSRELHPHLLRHTFASHLMAGGADARSVQEMLGHASLETTQIYTHLDRTVLKAAHRKHHPRP